MKAKIKFFPAHDDLVKGYYFTRDNEYELYKFLYVIKKRIYGRNHNEIISLSPMDKIEKYKPYAVTKDFTVGDIVTNGFEERLVNNLYDIPNLIGNWFKNMGEMYDKDFFFVDDEIVEGISCVLSDYEFLCEVRSSIKYFVLI